MLLMWCLIHRDIIILRHVLDSPYFCQCLDLRLFMSYLCDLFFFLIFVVIMINRRISWVEKHMFFGLFLEYVFSFLDDYVDEECE